MPCLFRYAVRYNNLKSVCLLRMASRDEAIFVSVNLLQLLLVL